MTTFGIDVSHHQPDFNFDAAAAEGIKFCYCKVSEGREVRDERWPEYREHALSAGLYVAGYHFLRSDSPPEDQARNAIGWLGKHTPLILDVEEDKSPKSQPTLKHVQEFISAAKELDAEVSMVYLPFWYWKWIDQNHKDSDLKPLPPIISSDYGVDTVGPYREIYPGDDSTRWKAYGGVTPTILQYGSRASVASQRVDVNAFRGPAAKLAKWFRSPPGESTFSLDEVLNPHGVATKEGDHPGWSPSRILDSVFD